MKRRIVSSLLGMCFGLSVFPQVSIETCYREARANYPLIKKYGLIEKSREFSLDNVRKGYLPQIQFSAKASYQSDVTDIPIDLRQMGFEDMEIPRLSQDQYGVTLDVNQVVWDGGEIRSHEAQVKSASEVEKRKVDVGLYAVRERVNQLYFGILLADAQLEQNRLLRELLGRNCRAVEAALRNGVANLSDVNAVKVDMLKAEQDSIGLHTTRQAYLSVLSRLTGIPMDEHTFLLRPEAERPTDYVVNRPELDLYEARMQDFRTELRKVTSGLMPKLGVFATGGYGRPGLDMFENKFSPYYMVGAKLTWNIGSFYTRKDRRRMIQNNIRVVESRRETFLFDTSLDVLQKDRTIEKYRRQLEYDGEIIRLKREVRIASEAKVADGTISGTDLMRDVNAEQQAVQAKIAHEIQLLLAVYELKHTTNH